MLGGWCYDFVRALSHGSFVTSLRMVPLRAHPCQTASHGGTGQAQLRGIRGRNIHRRKLRRFRDQYSFAPAGI